jgi:hypothetical protein
MSHEVKTLNTISPELVRLRLYFSNAITTFSTKSCHSDYSSSVIHFLSTTLEKGELWMH